MPTAPRSRSELDLAKIDWHRIDGTSEEAIARQAAEDPDTAPVLSRHGPFPDLLTREALKVASGPAKIYKSTRRP